MGLGSKILKPLIVVGIKPWKRWQVDAMLRSQYGDIEYCSLTSLYRRPLAGIRVMIWAAREPDGLAAFLSNQGAMLSRMEDGFLRSVGLGSNHVGGNSLVIDNVGIYFDPRTPSTLELMLENHHVNESLLHRAKELRTRLVERGLTKYNVGSAQQVTVGGMPGQLKILVPGQVENDASLRLGSPQIRNNLQLLQVVRRSNPEAWIVYKPHPDTEAGTRPGSLGDTEVLRYADQIAIGVSVATLFVQVDVVHTMTSLVGFEALLRGVRVCTWGQPFYSGWGLSEDVIPLPRRKRKRTIDELVACALILYPLYQHPVTRLTCTVEEIVDHLGAGGVADMRLQRSVFLRLIRQSAGMIRTLRQSIDQA